MTLGHNQPPDMATTVGEVANDLSNWMAQNPTIETEDKAREAKVLLDRASLGIKDLEDERTNKVRPLNEQVKSINDHYRGPRELLERVADELKTRMDHFLLEEEAKRIAAAEEARKLAAAAEQAARDAERIESERLLDARNHGELDVDVRSTVEEADRAFAAYQKAERQAQIAERETKVRIGGGYRRSISLRSSERLIVTDLVSAVQAMKDSARIIEAVTKSARSYKQVHGEYPPGIKVQIERGI